MQPRDRELENLIKHMLVEDTRVDPKEVNLRVENGVVHLEGTVDSAAERKAVYDDVEAVAGVTQIDDNLKLRNFIERSDDELMEAVKQDLMRAPYVNASGIDIIAHNGEVTLKGRVQNFAEKSAAENVAWWTPGVLNVVSQLSAEETDLSEDEPVW
jgi:osmotically-inducible protein OsmY